MTRRTFLEGAAPLAVAARAAVSAAPACRLTDVTAAAGIQFHHNSGAFGARYLPETMGPGCAFFDYDGDGWLDILLVNGMDWPDHQAGRSAGRTTGRSAEGITQRSAEGITQRSAEGMTRRSGGGTTERSAGRTTMRLFRNNRNGTFTDVTERAGLAVEMYGLGVAIGDYNNDGFPDLLVTAVGQNRLFQNNGRGRFVDVTEKAGLGGRSAFSTSALWFDFDRDGLLDLFVCNYVKWSPEHDVFCSVDGRRKTYCTPEAYHGESCWLFRNRGNGTFEDVTARSGIFDSTSKSLGVAMLDYDRDGWPDLLVANDTQPNKLYRNLHNGTFEEVGVRAGVAFSEDGKARAGMGVDAGDFENSGSEGLAITNFDNEMIALYRAVPGGGFSDIARRAGVGQVSRSSLGFGCAFLDINLDGYLDLIAVNGHIDETVRRIHGNIGYAQSPHLFLNQGKAGFRDIAAEAGATFAAPKVARGLAYGDFDNDGDLDLLITTNQGAAYLYRNDLPPGSRSLRLRLTGTKSNRDAIGAVARIYGPEGTQTRMVRSGSSYLSQSELTITFGLNQREQAARLTIEWPSGAAQEFKNVKAGSYQCIEGDVLKAR